MSINNIINEFQNYTYDNTNQVSSAIFNLKQVNTLNTDDLNIKGYILPEVITLLNKAVLNRLSSDLLFQKNYWSWGFVTLYYSNFFLAQALNRLKGDFFSMVPNMGRKNIKLDNDDGKYKLFNANSSDSHKTEFERLRENYLFLLLNSSVNNMFLKSIPDDYTSNPFFNESKIRNDINYKLIYYREFSFKELKLNRTLDECNIEYKNILDRNSTHDEFKLLEINIDRFNLLFHILNKIKNINSDFEVEYDKFLNNLETEISYKFKKEILRKVENSFNSNMNFHTLSTILEKQFKGAIYEL